METLDNMEYRISTITAIAKLNTLIILEKLYNIFQVDDEQKLYYNTNKKNIINNLSFVEYGKTKDISNSKGVNPKYNKKKTYKKKLKKSKRFDNQLTIILHINGNYINMKIFKNGRIQMTGLKTIDNGPLAIDLIINIINNLNNINKDILENGNLENTETILLNNDIKYKLEYTDFKICLINSNFKFTSKIRRNKFFQFLNEKTEIICSYEPCIYPGVKIQFFYNIKLDGVCRCSTGFCSNKKKESMCVKVTIAVFESGCTIITGAKSLEQLNAAYNYIKKLLINNIESFKKIDIDQLLLE
tara:strand:- start:1293 stop:2195 length:903 start_codon:yes stop_codon:yes gene_type:complete